VGKGQGGLDVSSGAASGQDNPHTPAPTHRLLTPRTVADPQRFARPSQLRASVAGPGPRAARACLAPGSRLANDSSMPKTISVGINADPPYDTSGSGIPVMGRTPITAPMLTMACTASHAVALAAASCMNGSFTRRAMRSPAYASSPN